MCQGIYMKLQFYVTSQPYIRHYVHTEKIFTCTWIPKNYLSSFWNPVLMGTRVPLAALVKLTCYGKDLD